MPKFVFHASPTGDIKEFEPRNGATPTVENRQSPARVYATDNPAYAAGHGFDWSTNEGVSLGFRTDEVGQEVLELEVPSALTNRLNKPVYVYSLPGELFDLLPHVAPFGHNYASTTPVKPIDVARFPDVRTAVESYGGVVKIKV
jgi:hypothetical protein